MSVREKLSQSRRLAAVFVVAVLWLGILVLRSDTKIPRAHLEDAKVQPLNHTEGLRVRVGHPPTGRPDVFPSTHHLITSANPPFTNTFQEHTQRVTSPPELSSTNAPQAQTQRETFAPKPPSTTNTAIDVEKGTKRGKATLAASETELQVIGDGENKKDALEATTPAAATKSAAVATNIRPPTAMTSQDQASTEMQHPSTTHRPATAGVQTRVATTANPSLKPTHHISPTRALSASTSSQAETPGPIIVLGLMKCGTSSLRDYFRTNPSNRVSHWKCKGTAPNPPRYCGQCVSRNVEAGRPPLESCGDYNVWAQLDVAFQPAKMTKISGIDNSSCYFPQVEALRALIDSYPTATFILNHRPAEHWLQSVIHWHDLRSRLIRCNITGLPAGVGAKDDDMVRFYNRHTGNVLEAFPGPHRKRLVVLEVEDPNAGAVLEAAFGIPRSAWGDKNQGNYSDSTASTTTRHRQSSGTRQPTLGG